MAVTTAVRNDETLVDSVRNQLKQYYRNDPTFLSRPSSEQLSIYREALSRGVELVRNASGRARAFAENASDLDPTRIADVGELAGGFMEDVAFPDFVRDLFVGVHESLIEGNNLQVETLTKMIKEVSKPVSALARQVSDEDGLGEVAANDPLRFTMGGDGQLTDNQSNMQVDTSNDEIQRLMFEAKLKLARERRLMMREAMLVSAQRLVVEEATIRASVMFNIRANEAFSGRERTTEIEREGGQYGGSFFGLFGGGKNKRKTKISVSSRELQTQTQLTAAISGFVEIKMKSDYFALNNFADLFADESIKAAIAQAGPPGQGQQGAPLQAQRPAA